MTETATTDLVERSTSRINILWKVSELEFQRRSPKFFFLFNVSLFFFEKIGFLVFYVKARA